MWQAVKDELFTAIESGFPSTSVQYDAPDYEMLHNLRYNAATFAAFKNHDEVKKIQELLMDGDKPRKWKDFRDQALQISEQYNRRWLQTEYNHAMQSSRMARRWNDAVKTADLYPNLKYVAVQDERTRHDHKMLHGAVYPIGDSFWDTHYPPNGWGCRCTVRPTDAPVKEAESFPEVPVMFRNNPGKTGVIFPDNNPFAAAASGAEKEAIEKFVKENLTAYNQEDIEILKSNLEFKWALERIESNKDFREFPNLSNEEKAAINLYTANGFSSLNAELRSGDITKFNASFEKVLNTALDKLPKDTNEIYYRGVSVRKEDVDIYRQHWSDKSPKTEQFFYSTSKYVEIANDFNSAAPGELKCIFTINSKNGREITDLSEHPGEREVLLKSKTTFNVVDFREIKGKYETIYEIDLIEKD